MQRRLIECVPNFSEGRDRGKVGAIVSAMESAPGACVLDLHMDPDHNRSVVTLVGPPTAVAEAVLAGVGKAVELIDLNLHSGAHPRIGAADVVPFVPLENVELHECAAIARWAGERIWRSYGVPVYLYGAAALRPERRELPVVRRGQFEGLREQAPCDPGRRPDIGGPGLHPTAGAVAVGARKFLIAYNVNLRGQDWEAARRIAQAVRESSGGFRHVRAIGVRLESRGLVQVSMNLTDFERTPLEALYEAVRREAARHGLAIAGSEIVGLIPRKAYELAPAFFQRCENFHPGVILENRLAELESRKCW
ncbi:MAG: glutamate formimidoyltransferase [Bryobacterales bacterium]|nr:glutamate formimidoyltransferase [Bryobacterales bacterium]